MNFQLQKIRYTLLVFFTLSFISCNKQLDIDSSRIAKEEGFWETYEDARAGLIGAYGLFRAALAQDNAFWLIGELRDGDFTSLKRSDLDAVIKGNLNASYPVIQRVTDWRRYYAVINACNLFIERSEGCLADVRYTEAYHRLDLAQVRALRAFAYFYLVRTWGNVPFTTSSNEGGTFEALPKTNKDEILGFAEKELNEVALRLPYLYSQAVPEQIFPSNYYGGATSMWLNAPINRVAAYAMLAHIAAWRQHYIDVAVYTEFIQNNYAKSGLRFVSVDNMVSPTGLFSGNNNLSSNFPPLITFTFDKNRGETTVDGHIEDLTLAQTVNFKMSKQLPDIYVTKNTIKEMFPPEGGNDARFGLDFQYTPALRYTTYFENFDGEIPVFKKIRVVDGGNGIEQGKFAVFNSAIVFTRLEELMLLRAEALAALGQAGLAMNILNSLRGERDLNPVSAEGLTDKQIMEEIFKERRRELIGEGWRWFDLVRFHRLFPGDVEFDKLLVNDKTTGDAGIYWPIAQSVLSANTKLSQNTYWK